MNKALPLVCFCLVFLLTSSFCHANNLYIYLIGGQSNADGRARVSSLTGTLSPYNAVQSNIPIYYRGTALSSGTYTSLQPGLSAAITVSGWVGFGPEVAFGLEMSKTLAPGDKIAIIKYAAGGTNLYSQWNADGTSSSTNDGTNYKNFQSTVAAGLAAINSDSSLSSYNKILSGMLWIQGESDIQGATLAQAQAYGTNLKTFISDVRLTLNTPNLPFFFSRMSANQTSLTSTQSYLANYGVVRSGEDYVASNVSGAYEINTDLASFTTNSDKLHFDAAGQVALGTAFATAVAAESVPKPTTAMSLVLGLLVLSVISKGTLHSIRGS